jgi:outer membrane lipoprotein-sorting protein
MRGIGVAVWMMAVAIGAAPQSVGQPDLEALFARGRAALTAMHTLTATFTETTVSSLLRDPIVARGTLKATAPRQVVMEYTVPERKTLSVDATRLVLAWPDRGERQQLNIADAQKRVDKYFTDASVDELRHSFDMTLVQDPRMPNTDSLVMRPTRKQIKEGLARLQLWVDRRRVVLVKMTMEFSNGDSKTLEFTDIRVNPSAEARR